MPSAIEALILCEPHLSRIVSAKQAFDLPDDVVLHAGPPLLDAAIPEPLIASLAVSLIHARGITNIADAESTGREFRWQPAQDYGCVTPLAMTVIAQTPLFEVMGSINGQSIVAYAPVGAVNGFDVRIGKRDPAIVARLTEREEKLVPLLHEAMKAGALPLLPIAATALSKGDDLHVRSNAATELFTAELLRRLTQRGVDNNAAQWLTTSLAATPLFFLTLWMAACKCMSLAAESTREGTLVTRLAGNGQRLGIALSSAPEQWITMPAMAPHGPRFPHAPQEAIALGAIGDSGVIDAMGFGGMVLLHAPETRTVFNDFITDDELHASQTLLSMPHDGLCTQNVTINVGLDAKKVANSAIDPIVTIAVVEGTSTHGLLGRGIIRPPQSLFRYALDSAL